MSFSSLDTTGRVPSPLLRPVISCFVLVSPTIILRPRCLIIVVHLAGQVVIESGYFMASLPMSLGLVLSSPPGYIRKGLRV